jgi:hypothetical protein
MILNLFMNVMNTKSKYIGPWKRFNSITGRITHIREQVFLVNTVQYKVGLILQNESEFLDVSYLNSSPSSLDGDEFPGWEPLHFCTDFEKAKSSVDAKLQELGYALIDDSNLLTLI